jgi:hypothetical protein
VLRHSPERLRADIDGYAQLQLWQSREQRARSSLDLARAEMHSDFGVGAAFAARSGRSDMLMLEFSVGLPLFSGN